MNINGESDSLNTQELDFKTQNIDLAITTSGITNFLGDLKLNGVAVGGGQLPPVPSSSTILSNIDYSEMFPASMLASITEASGGTNKCWGHTAIYEAGVNLLAGRFVALMDSNPGTDNSAYLKVQYLKNGDETSPTIAPIGVTQGNALIGEKVTVCVLGHTSAICENSDTTPERGSQIISDTGNVGKIRINNTAGGNQARLGFLAQSNAITSNSPCLIYVDSWFQPY
jgi:energy-converting hydrogenase Eha subunit A